MPRMPLSLVFCTLISSTPLVTGLALAEPAAVQERSAQAAPSSRSPTDTGDTTTVHRNSPPPTRAVDSITPSTPMPMNLPDEATASEVKNEYAIGMVGLVLGGVFLTALVGAVLFIISRRSWSTTH